MVAAPYIGDFFNTLDCTQGQNFKVFWVNSPIVVLLMRVFGSIMWCCEHGGVKKVPYRGFGFYLHVWT